MDIVTFLILSLATFRLSRIVIVDTIFENVREKIWKKYPPSTKIGYLLTCFWCTSVWVASVVVICYTIIPTATVLVAGIFALSAIAGLISSKLDN